MTLLRRIVIVGLIVSATESSLYEGGCLLRREAFKFGAVDANHARPPREANRRDSNILSILTRALGRWRRRAQLELARSAAGDSVSEKPRLMRNSTAYYDCIT